MNHHITTKKCCFLIISLHLSLSTVLAQVTFDNGYFIDNDDNRKEALIKNMDWAGSPDHIIFKHSENDPELHLHISELKEFSITGFSKYIKARIKIPSDKDSSEALLHVLIEGPASLYKYNNKGNSYFFISNKQKAPQLLIYTKSEEGRVVQENKKFMMQLASYLRCEALPINSLANTRYNSRSLIKYFEEYYECTGEDYINWNNKNNPKDLFFKVTGGVGISGYKLGNVMHFLVEHPFKMGFNIGIEGEIKLPFHRKKWAIAFESSYHSHRSSTVIPTPFSNDGYLESKVHLKSLEFLLGGRYYLLQKEMKIYMNAALFYPFFLKGSSIETIRHYSSGAENKYFHEKPASYHIRFTSGLGIGYKRFSLESRYYSKKNILSNWTAESPRVNLIAGFSI